MSFAVEKDLLTSSVAKVRKSICFYMGTTCDCKFMNEDTKIGSGECSGCPELYEVLALLEAMTPEEFETIRSRAKLIISAIDIKDTL